MKEDGARWEEAMDHILSNIGIPEVENPKPDIDVLTANNDQKWDEIILILNDIRDILKKRQPD